MHHSSPSTPVSADPSTLPALVMCPGLWNRLSFPVCLCAPCALVNLENQGFLLLKDHRVCNSCLNVKAGHTLGDFVIFTYCITWQSVLTDKLRHCRTPSERHSRLPAFGANKNGPAEIKHASAVSMSPDMLRNTANYIVLLHSRPPLQADLQPRDGAHYSKCLLTTGIKHNCQLGLKERAPNGLV